MIPSNVHCHHDQKSLKSIEVKKYMDGHHINLPTARRIAIDPKLGWSVVVVGDLKTPADSWSTVERENFYYLSPELQTKLFPEFSEFIGFGTYARKNIGYLFAISNGAQAIWDTDDDTYIRSEARPFLSDIQACDFLQVTGHDYFNPYLHFAPKSGLWPRGYPLRRIATDRLMLPERLKIVPSKETVDFDILQTLVNVEPDLDAIYRMTIGDGPLDFDFSSEILAWDKMSFLPGIHKVRFG